MMVRPYLYAKTLFRSRSKDVTALKADESFFQTLLLCLKNPVMKAFLKHPGYSRIQKFKMLSNVLLQSHALSETQGPMLALWIEKGYLKLVGEIYKHWKILFENHQQRGCIVVSSAKPLAPSTQDSLIALFEKAYPQRRFTVQHQIMQQVGYTAQFRDSILDLRASVLLKKFILSLKEGF